MYRVSQVRYHPVAQGMRAPILHWYQEHPTLHTISQQIYMASLHSHCNSRHFVKQKRRSCVRPTTRHGECHRAPRTVLGLIVRTSVAQATEALLPDVSLLVDRTMTPGCTRRLGQLVPARGVEASTTERGNKRKEQIRKKMLICNGGRQGYAKLFLVRAHRAD
jgi:hypothetical protein